MVNYGQIMHIFDQSFQILSHFHSVAEVTKNLSISKFGPILAMTACCCKLKIVKMCQTMHILAQITKNDLSNFAHCEIPSKYGQFSI